MVTSWKALPGMISRICFQLDAIERLKWTREIGLQRAMELNPDHPQIIDGLKEIEIKTIRDLATKPEDYEFTRVTVVV